MPKDLSLTFTFLWFLSCAAFFLIGVLVGQDSVEPIIERETVVAPITSEAFSMRCYFIEELARDDS